MRRAAKTDANQGEIVETLRMVGASVQPLHAVGDGVTDLLVGYRGANYLIEVKDGRKPPSARKLTPDQAAAGGPATSRTESRARLPIRRDHETDGMREAQGDA